MKKQILIFSLIVFLTALASYAQDDIGAEIENLGNIKRAYDDLVIKKDFIQFAGDLKILYDSAGDYSIDEAKAKINDFYKKAGLKQPYGAGGFGFRIGTYPLIGLAAVILIAIMFFGFRKMHLKVFSKLSMPKIQKYLKETIEAFRKKEKDIVDILKELGANQKEAEDNYKLARELNRKIAEGRIAELKAEQEKDKFRKELAHHIEKLGVWAEKVKELVSSTMKITEESMQYLLSFERNVENEIKLLNEYNPKFFSAEYQEKIMNLADQSAEEKEKLLKLIKLSNELAFALGHFKEKLLKQLGYIIDEKKYTKLLLKAVKKGDNKGIMENIKVIFEIAGKIVKLYEPKIMGEKSAGQELDTIKADVFAMLGEFESLKIIDLKRIKTEAEVIGFEVKNLIIKMIEAKKQLDEKEFFVLMNKLYEKSKNSTSYMRIILVQNNVDEKIAKDWINEFINKKEQELNK